MKPDNILVDLDYETGKVNSVKIIDLGSGIKFDEISNSLLMTTPEYLPPELLEIN